MPDSIHVFLVAASPFFVITSKRGYDMSFSWLSVSILIVFATILFIEIRSGIRKGARLSMVSLGTVIVSLLLSLQLSPLIAMPITYAAFRFGVQRISAYRRIIDIYPSLDALVQAGINMILGTILFIFVFFLLRMAISGIFKLVYFIIRKINRKETDYSIEGNSYIDKNSKAIGGIAGVLSAILITMALTAPVMGTLDLATKALKTVNQVSSTASSYIGEEPIADLHKYSDDVVGNAFYQLGGKLMYESSASTYMYGEKVYLVHEFDVAQGAIDRVYAIYGGLQHPESATAADIEGLYLLCDDLQQLSVFDGILADMMVEGANAWKDGYKYFWVRNPAKGTLAETPFNQILDVCAQANKDNAKMHMTTLLKVYAIIMDSGILKVDTSDLTQIMTYMENNDVVARLDAVLAENPYMRDISVSSLVLSAISDQLLVYDYDEEQVAAFSDDIAKAINTVNGKGYGSEEERAEAFASYIKKHLEEYGYTVPQDVAKLAATELINALPGQSTQVDAGDIRQIIESYSKK